MARRREHISAYLRICVSAYLCSCVQKNHKKTGNNHWKPSENNNQHLKKIFGRVLMRSCIAGMFLKSCHPVRRRRPATAAAAALPPPLPHCRRHCHAATAIATLPRPPLPCCRRCHRRRANAAAAAAAGHTGPVGIGKDGGHGGWLVLGVERWRCGLLGYKKRKKRRQKSCLWTGLIHRGEDSTKSG
jgi:hypothetical protein